MCSLFSVAFSSKQSFWHVLEWSTLIFFVVLINIPFTNEKTWYQKEYSRVTEAGPCLEPHFSFSVTGWRYPCRCHAPVPRKGPRRSCPFPSCCRPTRLSREPVSYFPELQIRVTPTQNGKKLEDSH